jgi:hypothetical protein
LIGSPAKQAKATSTATLSAKYIRYARLARHHLLRANEELGTEAFDPGWVALGKNPRVMASLPFVNRGEVKLTRAASQQRIQLAAGFSVTQVGW